MREKPTRYEDVNSIVLLLLHISQEILGENILAMYLHGSLATGDFNKEKGSDIDFLVVLDKEVSDATIQQLREMLGVLAKHDPELSKKLEGSYVPKGWLKSNEPPKKVRPYINGGGLNLYPYGYEWVLEKFLIIEKGIVIFGPPPSQFIEPVSADNVRRANVKILIGDWQPMLSEESSRLKDGGYQAYAVLTMCRCLFLFANNEMASKPTAIAWVKEKFPKWKKFVEVASNWRAGQSFDKLKDVKDFIKFTIEFTNATNEGEKDNIA